jgi:hypothetical protein
MSNHHRNGPDCALCDEKILTMNPRLQVVARQFKQLFPDGHISWGFRDEENQNRLFEENKTKAKWPNSKHNIMKDGAPCAEAFDFFRINPYGVPEWRAAYCQTVWNRLDSDFHGEISWAGNWKSFKEMDHIQLAGEIKC